MRKTVYARKTPLLFVTTTDAKKFLCDPADLIICQPLFVALKWVLLPSLQIRHTFAK